MVIWLKMIFKILQIHRNHHQTVFLNTTAKKDKRVLDYLQDISNI